MKSFRFYVLISFVFFAGILNAQNELLTSAKDHFKNQKYSEAIPLFEKHLLSHYQDVNAQRLLALSYQNAGMSHKANQMFKYLLSKPHPDSELYFEYGEFLRNQTDFVSAKGMYLKYAQFNPAIGNYFAQSCDFALAELTKPKSCSLDKVEEAEQSSLKESGNEQTTKSAPNSKPANAPKLIANSMDKSIALDEIIHGKSLANGIIAYSDRRDFVAFTKSNKQSLSTLMNQSANTSLYFAQVDQDGSWSGISTYEYSSQTYSTNFPALADQGNTLYFASNKPGGYGGYDLYVSYRESNQNSWSEPQNLGSLINSPGNEISPFYKNNDLFFSSDWHNGFGGFDVFRSTRDGIAWSDIHNLGACVNSTKDEYQFILDTTNDGVFLSNRESKIGGEHQYKTSKVALNNGVGSAHPIMESDISFKSPMDMNILVAPLEVGNIDETGLVFDDPNIGFLPKNQQLQKVYFIQIAAISHFNEAMADRFKKFTKYGDVYRVESDGINKIRIGSFQKLNDALATLSLMKKSGIKEAFVVADILDDKRFKLILKNSTDFKNIKETIDETGKFKIRVAEFKAPDWFDPSPLRDIGKIEHWTKGGWTIIVLGDFANSHDAIQALDKVKAKGFKEAYIVIEENGKLFRQ
ncbi:MAG: PD40 domain-containing protein [Saprospiraceae bacterium]|nr:PD40 domain-containing protein [Candidatus Vicinibacter affinis]MBP6173254.1 PD40 domain-containing protein [Saprospiraceae bacterium]MBK7799167.1 PD40 domain-containing protein [Candidatus Vicinibacter affinis]MBK9641861.1 PD40 domain-containing protein [Candidatus Vicinibacter affinis]MBK9960837.1 PD40 domain-containing protein [Candidatus Vicinibacter affinis]